MPTLAEIPAGQSATIIAIEGDDEIALRLMEMGVIDGESVQVVGCAPMGDPIEIAVRGYRLSLRRTEAQRIEVARPEANCSQVD